MLVNPVFQLWLSLRLHACFSGETFESLRIREFAYHGSQYGCGGDAALTKAPKWLKRPVGVSFGFGGKLVSFFPKKGSPASSEVIEGKTKEGLVEASVLMLV